MSPKASASCPPGDPGDRQPGVTRSGPPGMTAVPSMTRRPRRGNRHGRARAPAFQANATRASLGPLACILRATGCGPHNALIWAQPLDGAKEPGGAPNGDVRDNPIRHEHAE